MVSSEHHRLLEQALACGLSPSHARAAYRWGRLQVVEGNRRAAAGQMDYPAVAYGEPQDKPATQCRWVWVRLTRDEPGDGARLHPGGDGGQAVHRARLVRLALEAVEQGGQLALEDLGVLLGLRVDVVRRMVRDLHQQGVQVPVHGLGGEDGRSHRAAAVRLYLQWEAANGSRSPGGCAAVRPARYLQEYHAVVQALTLGVPAYQIPRLLGMPARLVGEYITLAAQERARAA